MVQSWRKHDAQEKGKHLSANIGEKNGFGGSGGKEGTPDKEDTLGTLSTRAFMPRSATLAAPGRAKKKVPPEWW